MTAEQAANLGACGAGSAYGMNENRGCAALMKAAHSIWLFSPSLIIPASQDFDLDYVKSLQKAGQLVIIKGVSTFAETGNDDAIETQDDDTQDVTNLGKYKFLATFTSDMFRQKALGTVEGFGGWKTGIVDKAGTLWITKHADGGYKGFKTGMIRRAKLTPPSNTVTLKQGLEWQLLERYELDDDFADFRKDVIGFDPRQVESINQVVLSFVNAPSDADTTLVVKVTSARGNTGAISGINFDQFKHTKAGAASEPTADDDEAIASGTYTLTVPALVAGDENTLKIGNQSNGESIVEVTDLGMIKSATLSYTVLP